ncbi:MAG: efflux RND transporter permease subunit [Deltaproteobacteria bacterium]
MKIHEVSIKRPVTVLMCVLIALVLGFISLSRVSIDLMPNIKFPIAIVSTTYSGVGPQEIESVVSKNIENAIATVSNIKTIQSQSSAGSSLIIAEFNSGTDMNFATLQMREKIDLYKKMLPSEVENPMVIKMDPSMIPILNLGITGNMDNIKLKRFVEDKIKQRLESQDGVASVTIRGGETREIRVKVNPEKLSGYGMNLNQVVTALQTENLNQSGGTVDYGDKTLLIRSTGEFKSLEQINNVPIILPNGNVLYIRDIADVSDSFKKVDSHTRMNGGSSIGVIIQKQSNSNTVKVVNRLKEEIKAIEKEYPGISIKLLFDQGKFIEQSIQNVAKDATLGAILAIFILFLFLKNIRATLIVGTAIPLSIIVTFILIYFGGTTLNLVSLGGLALGVGRLVDDAIVVLENIYRHIDQGYDRVNASITATAEVGRAVIASTLTTVIVFLPIAFAEGIAAQIFKELALTVTFALLASLAVSLTVIPTLSARFLNAVDVTKLDGKKSKGLILKNFNALFGKVDAFYRKVLRFVLHHRFITTVTVAGVFVLSLALVPLVGAEFFPTMDQGQFTVSIELPQGTLLERTNGVTMKAENILKSMPEMEKYFVTVGGGNTGMSSLQGSVSNTASISATLKPLNKRNRSTAQVVDEIRKKLEIIPGAEIKVTEVSSTMGGGFSSSSPISLSIKGPELDVLKQTANQIVDAVSKVEGTRQVESSIAKGRPEAQIIVNREKASNYGLGTAQIANTIRNSIEGKVATRYRVSGEEYDIRVELPETARKNFEQLKSMKIMAASGVEVPLYDLAEIRIEEGPTTISRQAQQRFVTVSSDIFGRDIGSINKDIKAQLDKISIPEGYTIEFGGQQKEMVEAFASLLLALVLGFLLVYMVMASQFESLIHPFTIMFSVPLAFTGAALGLVITHRAFSVPAFIGLIMLTGIVVSNAIVLLDYINTLRGRGMEREEAILKAGPTRLRPILMTSLVTVLALLPLALGIGEGAETQAPLATVVIGGLISSTILTLLILPVIYTYFDDLGIKFKAKRKAKKMKAQTVDNFASI